MWSPIVRARPSPAAAGEGALARLTTSDRAGLMIAAAFAVWTVAAGLVSGGNPWPVVGLVAGCGLAFTAGRDLERRYRGTGGALVAGFAVILTATSVVASLVGRANAGPLGYENANAALFVLGAVGASTVAVLRREWRWPAVAVSGTLAAVPFLTGARAASGVLVAVAIVSLIGAAPRGRRLAPLVAAALFVMALGFTVWVAWTPRPREALVERLGQRRVALWSDALDAMTTHPVAGVGAGRFASIRTTAPGDPDARWAHHDFLERGAETGVVGLALLVLLFLWAMAGAGAAGSVQGVMVSAGIAGLGTLASFDHILHFWPIPLCAAALVGAVSSASAEVSTGGLRPVRTAIKMAALPLGIWTRRRPGDVVVLLYHRVGVGTREIDVQLGAFERHMTTLLERETVLSLDQALRGGDGGVVVTFDDGFPDFADNVVPVLEALRIPATLYLATGLVDQGPDALSWTQLGDAVASGLVTVGSHTHGHVDLSLADARVAEDEMRRSKELIEDRLGVACRHFAYPWAVGSSKADEMARRHFDSAALGAWVTNRLGRMDPYRLGRTPVLRGDMGPLFRAKANGLLDGEGVAYRLLRRGPWRPT